MTDTSSTPATLPHDSIEETRMTERPTRRYDCAAHGLEPVDREPATHVESVTAVDASAAQDSVWEKLESQGWRVDSVDVDEARHCPNGHLLAVTRCTATECL